MRFFLLQKKLRSQLNHHSWSESLSKSWNSQRDFAIRKLGDPRHCMRMWRPRPKVLPKLVHPNSQHFTHTLMQSYWCMHGYVIERIKTWFLLCLLQTWVDYVANSCGQSSIMQVILSECYESVRSNGDIWLIFIERLPVTFTRLMLAHKEDRAVINCT